MPLAQGKGLSEKPICFLQSNALLSLFLAVDPIHLPFYEISAIPVFIIIDCY